jgi:CheY-like chemotaxis protein
MRRPLGEILVTTGVITAKTLEHALDRQRGTGKLLGAVLAEMGVVNQEELAEALELQAGMERAAVGKEGLKILIVDDSCEVTAEIGEALKQEGYQVQTANDGVDGLTIAFAGKPDMILCGASMPRMDGYALMRAIKANPATASTPMILLTSKSSPEEKHRALKSGFHDFIVKPMMTVRVVSRVKSVFEIVRQLKEREPAPITSPR